MNVGCTAKSFTAKLADCDERIAQAERHVARQRGIIARMVRKGFDVSRLRQTLQQSVMLLEEMKRVRAFVLKYYGYAEYPSPRRPRLVILDTTGARIEEGSYEVRQAVSHAVQ